MEIISYTNVSSLFLLIRIHSLIKLPSFPVAESAGKNSTRQPQEIIEPESNSVIETPEDLEKWLDDFLDG